MVKIINVVVVVVVDWNDFFCM